MSRYIKRHSALLDISKEENKLEELTRWILDHGSFGPYAREIADRIIETERDRDANWRKIKELETELRLERNRSKKSRAV